jgi:crotonobetainyl-CoA:carnitine CoA-transferase CaiB-like acyl-CoA transferase
VVIAANAESLWKRLCETIGRPDLLEDPRFETHRDRGQNMAELDEIIGEWAGRHDAEEIDRIMAEAGVVSGPVNSIEDIFSDPHMKAREMLIEMEDPELGELAAPGIVPKLSETPGAAAFTGAWELGERNAEVYGDLLGLSAAEIAELGEEGVI